MANSDVSNTGDTHVIRLMAERDVALEALELAVADLRQRGQSFNRGLASTAYYLRRAEKMRLHPNDFTDLA